MASLIRAGKAIQFVNANGVRKTISLGRMPKKRINTMLLHVEELNSAAIGRVAVGRDTANWLRDLEPAIYSKLEKVGLVAGRVEPEKATLVAFIDRYIAERSDVKERTATAYRNVRRNLAAFFGAEKQLAEITSADADDFRRYLACPKAKAGKGGAGLGENTVRRRCAIAKQFFRVAVRKRLISENPFSDMSGLGVRGNKSRDFFVSREMAERILEMCPDSQWRLLFALSRFGGLRCPSEHLALRWTDVNWERNRITITSPKTEHFEGKESREIPLFPELRPYLEDAQALAETGAEFVITRYRDTNQNLRTQLERIIRKAGLTPWPKLFQNLRATRETELAESYPIHVVCAWIGNTEAIAAKHYLQVTDEHFQNAAQCSALQKALQQGADSGGMGKIPKLPIIVFPEENTSSHFCATGQIGPVGLEPTTKGL